MSYNSGKNITPLYVRENILSPEVWEKNSYLNQNIHLPSPSKVKWSTRNMCIAGTRRWALFIEATFTQHQSNFRPIENSHIY